MTGLPRGGAPEEGSPLRDRMIFIVGARRSGTNWLQRLLGAHPAVALVPSETYLFSRGLKPLRERLHHGVMGSPGTAFVYMDPTEMTRRLRDFADAVFVPFLEATPGATRLVERTPEHVTCLDLIGEIYPDGTVIHIVRDGRDVARSLLGQDWKTKPGSLKEAAEEWRTFVEAGESAGASLRRYRTIRYEHLLGDPRSHVAELFDWLSLPASPEVVEAALAEAEIRFNEDPDAPTAAEGKWREHFTRADLDGFMAVAGEALARLGYETDGGSFGSTRRRETSSARVARALGKHKARDDDAALQRVMTANLTDVQRLLDRVVAAMVRRRIDELREMCNPSMWIRVIEPRGAWKGRGEAAWDRLAWTIENDPAFGCRQVTGEMHPAFPTSTAVLTFDGQDVQHVCVVGVSIYNELVTRLIYYRFAAEPLP